MRKLMERNTLLPGSPPAASASASASAASASEPDPAAEVDDTPQLQPVSPQSPQLQQEQAGQQPQQQPQQRLQQPFILVATQPQAVVHVNESPDRRTVEFSFR